MDIRTLLEINIDDNETKKINNYLLINQQRFEGVKKEELIVISEITSTIIKKISTIKEEEQLSWDFLIGLKDEKIQNEFDLLKLTDKNIINIEIKTVFNEDKEEFNKIKEKAHEQLKKHLIYFKNYQKNGEKILLYSIIYYKKKLIFFKLEQEEFIDISEKQFVDNFIKENKKEFLIKKFDMSNMKINLFEDFSKFKNKEYILSESQKSIKRNIIKELNLEKELDESKLILIEGEAGTGKSLILYDLILELIELGQKDKIIFTFIGKPKGFHWNFSQNICKCYTDKLFGFKGIINKYNNDESFLGKKFIFVDEAQRMNSEQIFKLNSFIETQKAYYFLFYDKKQLLGSDNAKAFYDFVETKKEEKRNNQNVLMPSKLSKLIRSNIYQIGFINQLNFGTKEVKNAFIFKKPNSLIMKEIEAFKDNTKILKYKEDFLLEENKNIKWSFTYEQKNNQNDETIKKIKEFSEIKIAQEWIGEEGEEINIFFDKNFFYNSKIQNIDWNIDNLGTKWSKKQKIKNFYEMYINFTRSTKKLNIYVYDEELFYFLTKLKKQYILFLKKEYISKILNNS